MRQGQRTPKPAARLAAPFQQLQFLLENSKKQNTCVKPNLSAPTASQLRLFLLQAAFHQTAGHFSLATLHALDQTGDSVESVNRLEWPHGTREAGNSGLQSHTASYFTDVAQLIRSVLKLHKFAEMQHRTNSALPFRAHSHSVSDWDLRICLPQLHGNFAAWHRGIIFHVARV